jgi:hypothetical protein
MKALYISLVLVGHEVEPKLANFLTVIAMAEREREREQWLIC